ncbi:MAG: tetratricopeptide repeat protein [Pseudomonadota bacterium]
MSYINDALKRAQQDKDNLYSHYGGIISQWPGYPARSRIKRAVAAVSAVLALAAVLVWMTIDSSSILRFAGKKELPLQAGAEPAQKQAVVQRTPGEPSRAAEPPAETARRPFPDAPALYQEALAAQRSKKAAVAEWLYRRVLTIDAQHVEAMNNLGVLYLAQGKQAQALEMFNQAISLKKNYADPYYNLSCLFAQRKNTARSLQYLKSAIAVNGDVIHWAKGDRDLKDITASEAFKKLMENKGS